MMSCFCAFFIPTSHHFLEENFCFLYKGDLAGLDHVSVCIYIIRNMLFLEVHRALLEDDKSVKVLQLT